MFFSPGGRTPQSTLAFIQKIWRPILAQHDGFMFFHFSKKNNWIPIMAQHDGFMLLIFSKLLRPIPAQHDGFMQICSIKKHLRSSRLSMMVSFCIFSKKLLVTPKAQHLVFRVWDLPPHSYPSEGDLLSEWGVWTGYLIPGLKGDIGDI